jgi:6-phosphogluconolactonase (cycloisomerase 2 family)
MIVDSGEKFLYVANSFDNTVSGFSIASTGALALLADTPIATGTSPSALAFDGTGAFLYAANFTSTNISGFAVDSTSGKLTVIDNSPFTGPASPAFMVLAPSGKYLLIGSQSANTITEYTFDTSNPPTGALTAGKSVTLDAAPVSIALTK